MIGISDDEILTLLAKMIKQREESAAVYDSGGRPELAAGEREEVEIIQGFMPKQMSADEALAAAKAALAETGAASMKDMGKVMAVLKERHAGQMDFAGRQRHGEGAPQHAEIERRFQRSGRQGCAEAAEEIRAPRVPCASLASTALRMPQQRPVLLRRLTALLL